MDHDTPSLFRGRVDIDVIYDDDEHIHGQDLNAHMYVPIDIDFLIQDVIHSSATGRLDAICPRVEGSTSQ
jgi:hypothetical protein